MRDCAADLPRGLDGLERDPDLRFRDRLGELFDGAALAIAAQEIHPRVGARRIAPQRVFDEADALDVLAPVDRRAQAQAGDGVGDRRLAGGLALLLGADDVLGHQAAAGQVPLERGAQRRSPHIVFARAMQHLHQVGVVRVLGNRDLVSVGPASICATSSSAPRRALRLTRISSAEAAQVFDQRELQHARPRPQLAERQRRDALIAVQEQRELRQVEPAVGMAEQRDRHRVDARLARLLARGERRQLAVIAPRQVLANFDELRRDQVKVVEEPLGRRRDEGAFAHILGERAIRRFEDALVVAQPRIDAAGVPPPRIDRETGRQGERPLIEPLGAQRFVAKWPIAFPNSRARSREEQTEPQIQDQYQLESWISARS